MRSSGGFNPAVIQLYLAHKDASTAAYYLSNRAEDVRTEELDTATDKLGAWLGLEAASRNIS